MADEVVKEAVETKTDAKVDTKVETEVKESALSNDAPLEDVLAPADWPEDWRLKISGGDEKTAKTLERLKSPQDLWKSYLAAQRKLSTRATVDPFPEKGTDEEKQAWRAAQGIPEKPAEYLKDYTLESGIVIGEQDRPLVDEVLTAMHGENASPKVVQKAVDAYYKMQEREVAKRIAADREDADNARLAMKEEFGAEANQRLLAAKSVIELAPESVRDMISNARMANGQLLGSNPDVIKWLLDLSEEVNPAATVVAGAPAKSAQSLQARIADLKKMMGDKTSDYWKGPKAETLQEEYRKLVAAEEKMERKK